MLICLLALSLVADATDAVQTRKAEMETQRAAIVRDSWRIYHDEDSFAAAEYLKSRDNRLLAIDAWSQVVMDAYWERKDLTAVLALGRAGIDYALEVAGETEAASPDAAAKIRGVAKSIAYNIASFTWPGWCEPGITVTARDLALGMDAARANLRWARELGKDDLALSRADWMVGAHELAAGNYTEARTHFESASDYAKAAGNNGERLMNHAYALISTLVENPKDEGARRDYEETKKELAGEEDGQFFIDQLDSALAVFLAQGH